MRKSGFEPEMAAHEADVIDRFTISPKLFCHVSSLTLLNTLQHKLGQRIKELFLISRIQMTVAATIVYSST